MVSPLPFKTSALDFARVLLSTYPETSPFELEPPLPNLRPAEVEDEAYDTEEFKEAARENTVAMGGINPFSGQFGANTFVIPYELQRELSQPFTNYARPPTLNEADIRTELQFLEQIYPGGCVHLFKVRVNDEVRLLKVVSDPLIQRAHFCQRARDNSFLIEIQMAWKSPPTNPVRWYRRERDAYAHLLSYGICAKGIVPMCYGYVNITDEDVSQMVEIRTRGDFEHDVADLEYDDELPLALLLEYFDDAERIIFQSR